MPKYLSWSWCNNRTQVHNKCNAHQSPQNHAPPKSMEKLSSTKSVPGAKKVGDRWLRWPQQNRWWMGLRKKWSAKPLATGREASLGEHWNVLSMALWKKIGIFTICWALRKIKLVETLLSTCLRHKTNNTWEQEPNYAVQSAEESLQ